jgi:hypothetical protein
MGVIASNRCIYCFAAEWVRLRGWLNDAIFTSAMNELIRVNR